MQIPLLSSAAIGANRSATNPSQTTLELINYYFEKAPERESTSQGALLPVKSHGTFATVGSGPIRGTIYNPVDNLLYVVSENDFYEVTSAGTATDRGDLSTSSGLVQMALNPFSQEILIVDGTNGYIFDCAANTLTTITDADYPDTANACAFLNQRFIVNDPVNTGRFWWSDLNDGLTWDGASFATAESLSSTIVALAADRGNLYILGEELGELWYNTEDSDNPFQRFGYLASGCASRHTVKLFDNSVVWLARNRQGGNMVVRVGENFSIQVLSPEHWKTPNSSSEPDSFAYSYFKDGHEFYVITRWNFGGSLIAATFAYDAVTKEWHQRSGAFSSGSPTVDGICCAVHTPGWGRDIVAGSYGAAVLYKLETSTASLDRRITGPRIAYENHTKFRFSQVELDAEFFGDPSGLGGGETITLQYSTNNGQSFSTARTLTPPYYRARQFGHARDWVFRINLTTEKYVIIKGLWGRMYNEKHV